MGNLLSVFNPINGPQKNVFLSAPSTLIGNATVLSFEGDTGFRAQFSRPEHCSTADHPPDFKHQLRLSVEDTGSCGWFALVTKIDAAQILLAKDFYWEFSATSSIPIRANFDLRFHNHAGKFSSNILGFSEISSEKRNFSNTVSFESIERLPDAVETTLHFFFSLDAPFEITIDYIIAHYG